MYFIKKTNRIIILLMACAISGMAQESFTKEELLRKRSLDEQSIRIGQKAMVYRPEMELHVGDTLPNVVLQMVGYNKPEMNTAEWRGKYVIMSFWNTYCSVCMSSFARMEKRMPKYGDRLRVQPVTFEMQESIAWFYDRRAKMGKKMPFPSAVEDTLLRKFFPHYGDPHDIWIDPDGVVKAVTTSTSLNEENIIRFLAGKSVASDPHRYPYDPLDGIRRNERADHELDSMRRARSGH